MKKKQNNIRNFAIVAHVDHGKSTLADRFLEITGVLKSGNHKEQFLDRNPISRERGITIKLAPVRMDYSQDKSKIEDSKYILNLIDTPGHVDFSYEVDRTLACVEGIILLVDATQGIEAQTVANTYKGIEKDLVIIPAVNKIDLPSADISRTKKQIIDFLGVKENDIFEVSAKTGQGVERLLKEVIIKIPPPNFQRREDQNRPVQALIFDSYYDQHRGVIAFVRIFQGELRKDLKTRLFHTDQEFKVQEVGVFTPDLKPKNMLYSGEIGYVVTNLKDIHQINVGDTIVDEKKTSSSLSGYKPVKPMVFASIFPTDPNKYLDLKKGLEKLYLTDSAIEFKPIYSKALGSGFRIGFLGVLHGEVVRERLEVEFNQEIVITPPQVEFLKKENYYLEPYIKITIITPLSYMNQVMRLCEARRTKFLSMNNKNQVMIVYQMPMSEMIDNFFDQLKSVSSGYASLDWEFLEYRQVKADKLILLLNNDEVKEFSQVVVKEKAYYYGQKLVKKIKKVIPRQQFEVRIQAKYKGKIIASERIPPMRKDVTSKLYGGDRTRKDKLLKKQKEGKKRLKMIGKVEIPKEGFMKLFKNR